MFLPAHAQQAGSERGSMDGSPSGLQAIKVHGLIVDGWIAFGPPVNQGRWMDHLPLNAIRVATLIT